MAEVDVNFKISSHSIPIEKQKRPKIGVQSFSENNKVGSDIILRTTLFDLYKKRSGLPAENIKAAKILEAESEWFESAAEEFDLPVDPAAVKSSADNIKVVSFK